MSLISNDSVLYNCTYVYDRYVDDILPGLKNRHWIDADMMSSGTTIKQKMEFSFSTFCSNVTGFRFQVLLGFHSLSVTELVPLNKGKFALLRNS